MKKLFTILTIVALTSLLVFGQWQVVKEASAYYQPDDGYVIDANTVVIVCDEGEVVKTTDGGTTWTTLREADGSGIYWKEVEFADANVGYACADDGYIFKTTDGGMTWTMIGDTANFANDLKALSVVDANTVYFSGSDWTLLKTTDGGATYTALGDSATFLGDDLDGAIAFSDADNGVVISDGTGGYTWYTHDGGATWTFVSVASLFPIGTSSTRIYDVAVNGNTVVVGGYHYTLFISTDGGETYTFAGNEITYSYERFISVAVPDEEMIIATGTDGYTLMSTDGGANWTKLDIGTGQQAVFVDFPDVDTGYLFCYYGQFLKTTDGGATFTPLLEWPQVSFSGLAFPEEGKIVISAENGGEIAVSSDGGATWDYPNNLATQCVETLYECEFIDANTGLLGGRSGSLLRTTDGGATWTAIDNPMIYESYKHIYAIHVYDATTAFAGGSSGYLMRTTDGGLTWSNTKVGASTVYDIWPIDDKTVIATESSGQVWTGVFDADSIVSATMWNDWGSMYMRAIEIRNDVVIVPASTGIIYRTTTAELDTLYEVFSEPDGDDFYDVEFINDTLVVVVGENGKIYKSEDAGLTWTAEMSGTEETLQKVRYDGTNLWAVGRGGTILKYEFSELAIDAELSALPTSFALHQNFPNPFNPTTQISFEMPVAGNVRLEIYNILGQKVRTLVSRELNAGFHVYEWDALSDGGRSLAAGVYVYQLTAGDFVQQKKMLLLK